MEMIGLVMVVVILVLGIVLYAYFGRERDTSAANTRLTSDAKRAQSSSSFLTAMTEMTVPSCGVSFARLAKACRERERNVCDDPCDRLQEAMNAVVGMTQMEGRKYNLSLSGTAVQNVSDCPSGDLRIRPGFRGRAAHYWAGIPLDGAGRQADLTLDYCR